MEHVFVGTVAVDAGLYLMIFREKSAKYIITKQNGFWGFKFADKGIQSSKIILFITGFLFMVFGILSLLNGIKFK